MARLYILPAALAAFLLTGMAPPAAAKETHRTRYDVSLFGLPIGSAVLESRFEGRAFEIDGRFSSVGLARIFEPADGTVRVRGTVEADAARPREYTLAYTSGEKRKTTAIRFDAAGVTKTENRPARERHGRSWVPVERRHLQGVADPLSALLLPVGEAAAVCRRTIRVYDGETRVDLVLEPAAQAQAMAGASVTCRAHFRPVAGYRRDHSSIAYLRDRSRILVGFRKVEGRNLYSPAEATIATKIGTVHIKARPM